MYSQLTDAIGDLQADLALALTSNARDDNPTLILAGDLSRGTPHNTFNFIQKVLSAGEECVC
jgi:hypothetical protein